jgi:hypothetical protein
MASGHKLDIVFEVTNYLLRTPAQDSTHSVRVQ